MNTLDIFCITMFPCSTLTYSNIKSIHVTVKKNIIDIINLIVFFHNPIVKPILRVIAQPSFKRVMATTHTRSNNRDPIFAQLEHFVLLI